MLRPFFFIVCCLWLLPSTAMTAPLSVAVSIAPQKYILERIAGERQLEVTVLVKPGADPHSYEPSPSQMQAMSKTAVWFTIGVPFEDVWLPRLAEKNSAGQGMAVISFIKGIQRLSTADARTFGSRHEPSPHAAHNEHDEHDEHDEDVPHGHSHAGEDPHVWLSPMLVREMLPLISGELGKLLPDQQQAMQERARQFARELEKLDETLAARFADFPVEQRAFLTFHPSWRYFAYNYQLTELSIEVDGKEPGPKTMKTVIDAARRHGLNTIFVEPQFPQSAAEAIARGIEAKIVELDPLQENLLDLYQNFADKLIASFKKGS